jgi:hypothetical protein
MTSADYWRLSTLPTRSINVGIASPRDVAAERDAVVRVLNYWNVRHRELMLNAVGWEAASTPTLGDHPQNILNREVIEHCQLLVAVFWSRLGMPTPNAASGTVAEIEHFIRVKGPGRVMLYFCTRPLPHDVDAAELARLREYKMEMTSRGLYWEYQSVEEFEGALYRHLDGKVADFLAGRFPAPGSTKQADSLKAPLLRRLNLPYPFGEPGKAVLPIVQNGDMWQVVFGLSIRNDGTADARNWRVRFVTSDDGTMMGVNRARDGRNVTETFVGPGYQYEVFSAGSGDTVPGVAGMAVPIAGRHTLNFRDRPDTVEVICLLTADGMPAQDAVLRLEVDWATMTARFR